MNGRNIRRFGHLHIHPDELFLLNSSNIPRRGWDGDGQWRRTIRWKRLIMIANMPPKYKSWERVQNCTQLTSFIAIIIKYWIHVQFHDHPFIDSRFMSSLSALWMHSFIYVFIHIFIHSFVIHSSIHASLIHPSFICHSSIHAFIHSFYIHSFIHAFIYSIQYLLHHHSIQGTKELFYPVLPVNPGT